MLNRPQQLPRVHWLLAGLVLLAAVAAYFSGLSGPLLFDDKPNLTSNQLLHIDGDSLDGWRVASFSSGAGPLKRPLSMLTFAANYVASEGFTPLALKGTNLAIHLVIASLIYALVSNLARAPALSPGTPQRIRWMALAAAAVWLLHPLHVSTVLYAVQRMAQLSALFVVLGLLVYTHYRQQWVARSARSGDMLAAGLWLLLLTGLASYSKENGILLPWLLVVVEVSFYRGQWGGRQNRWLARAAWLALLAPPTLAAVVFVLQPDFFHGSYRRRPFDLEQRLLTQGRVLWHYMGWLVLPDIRSMGFQHDDIAISRGLWQPATTLLAWVCWAAVLLFSTLYRQRLPLVFFAVLFFLVAHTMESSVFALEMVYEHRNYLPGIGICIMLGAAISNPDLWRDKLDFRFALGAVLAVLVTLLFVRSYTWSDPLLMSRTNVENHPDSPRAHFFYGDALVSYHGRRAELGLSEDESRAVMVTAREQFVRMYEQLPADISSQVMLYIIDRTYFPQLAVQEDWLSVLESNLDGRVLQASDFAAVTALVKFVIEQGPAQDAARVLSLVDQLIGSKKSSRKRLLLQQYKYLLATEAPRAERLVVLDRLLQISPGSHVAQYYRAQEYAEAGQVAEAYEAVGDWMARDVGRWHLRLIKPLFQTAGED